MERTSPTHVVRLQRKNPAAIGGGNPSFIGADETTLPALMERASNAARQMRYFGLVAKRSSFSELLPSAKRAGFTLLNEDTQRKEATFQWSAGEPDFIFSVSFNDAARASIVAESCGDIFGLILTFYSHAPNISVETNPSLGNKELGRNALLFRDTLLIFPDFDDLPAWTKYWQTGSEPPVSTVGVFHREWLFDFARFRRGGVTAAFVMCRTWKPISSKRGSRFSLSMLALSIIGKLRFDARMAALEQMITRPFFLLRNKGRNPREAPNKKTARRAVSL
jgi:hypothetical protein